MAKSFWISAQEVVDNTVLSGDIDANKVRPFIEEAQDIDIKNLLGQNLYDKIDGLIEAGELQDAANEEYYDFVKDYVRNALRQAAAARYVEQSRYRVDDRGVYIPTAQKGQSATQDDVDMLADDIWRRYEIYAADIYYYLCEESHGLTEYNITHSGQIPPSYQPYNYPFSSF